MGLIVDTNVFITFERRGQLIDVAAWDPSGDVYISVVTVAELLLGGHRADTEERRVHRTAFVEAIIAGVRVLDFTTEVARVHARLYADLAGRGQLIGAHDLMIAATALYHGIPLLTDNVAEFSRVPGLQVISF